ncbi:MAG: TonB-dependent receptor [Flavobacteriales bacterium]|nr:TonB-dependent receptor [Flavobacteriales bacterium]
MCRAKIAKRTHDRPRQVGYAWRCCAIAFIQCLASDGTHAQTLSDTVQLHPFEVSAQRLEQFAAGTTVQRLDSATLERYRLADLGTALAGETAVFVKSYGLGSLATTSFRGGSANHTAILWNGFNIGSPMNGQIDLSLLPMAAVGEVSLQHGGTSALWGSGALGGAIHLSAPPRFGRGLLVHVGAGFGSYGDLRQQARVEVSGTYGNTNITLFQADARNDFHYRIGDGARSERREQINAGFQQQGLIAEQHFRLRARQQLSARVWLQRTGRHVPPTRVQPTSTAHQADGTLRATAEWSRTGHHTDLAVRGAFFDERLDWTAADDDPVVVSRSRSAIIEAEARLRLSALHALDIGLNNTYAQATTDGYPHRPEQDRAALFAAYRYQGSGGRTTGSVSARQELLDGAWMPFTASAGMEHAVRPWLKLKGQGARVYRVPTFNELYWQPGGDPDLLSESGFSGDAGLELKLERGPFQVRSTGTIFSRSIKNWIIWLPGPAYWSPHNVLQVWSRGLGTDSELACRTGRSTWKLGLLTDHVVSTNQRPTGINDASVDKQLIYVPMYSGHARIVWEQRNMTVRFTAAYTGYRYTSSDNRQFLEPYWIWDVHASYRLQMKARWSTVLFVSANNLFNADYEIMLNRPMPMCNYQAGVSLQFTKPVKTKDRT